MQRKGRFGVIEVVDHGQQRILLLNGQQQGASYLRPSAAIVHESLPYGAPGPISSSIYPLGWMLGAVMNPSATASMVGLGSGSGAVQLLYNFPRVDLTIIEIDPVMVQVALDNYPLLVHYMDEGRLNIVIEDAARFYEDHFDEWDFGCADAYDGGNEILEGYLGTMCERCRHMYVNVIDRFHGPSMRSVADTLERKGRQVAEILKAAPLHMGIPYQSRANWILTSEVPDMEKAADFTPFLDIDDVHAVDAQVNWDNLLASALSTIS